MTLLEQQLHGYRQGHQLLSSTIRLAKADQDLIDRISDVAGPLGPGEVFQPYLTFYPLPSGSHYVIARTWQDLTVPRAGCVRTRSALVPMKDWLQMGNISGVVSAVTEAGGQAGAQRMSVPLAPAHPLPCVKGEQVVELVEALFLEDRAPIVVFDAEHPDLISIRLLTAFWPALRQRFSISTFCRSPRAIARKSFDIVFAPKDAGSRFADWEGRRIDGRRREPARHRWSQKLVAKIFEAELPTLRTLDALGELYSDESDSEAALRVSLLWDELSAKMDASPLAALGLLDIAKTRASQSKQIIRRLQPALADAAGRASLVLPPEDGWRFLKALVEKLSDVSLAPSLVVPLREAASTLTRRAPVKAVEWTSALADRKAFDLLIGGIAAGLAVVFDSEVVDELRRLDERVLLALVLSSDMLSKQVVLYAPALLEALAKAINAADEEIRKQALVRFARFLVEDSQEPLAHVLFADLRSTEVMEQVKILYGANQLQSVKLRELLVQRASVLGIQVQLRDLVCSLGNEDSILETIEALLSPNSEDLDWLLDTPKLTREAKKRLLQKVLLLASPRAVSTLFNTDSPIEDAISLLDDHIDLILKVIEHASISSREMVRLMLPLLGLPGANIDNKVRERVFEASLQVESPEAEAVLNTTLEQLGSRVNGKRAFHVGLRRGTSSAVVSRNLIAFNRSAPARVSFLGAVEEMADTLVARSQLDVSVEAAEATAAILWDAREVNYSSHVRASAVMMAFLLRSRGEAASRLIAVTFAPVYQELKRESVPDLFRFMFLFVDWDKCKAARQSLVSAFMRSDWRPIDIALAAVRAHDADKIFELIAQERGGHSALDSMEHDINLLPPAWQKDVLHALRRYRNSQPNK